jgi:prefoldin subunit 5
MSIQTDQKVAYLETRVRDLESQIQLLKAQIETLLRERSEARPQRRAAG